MIIYLHTSDVPHWKIADIQQLEQLKEHNQSNKTCSELIRERKQGQKINADGVDNNVNPETRSVSHDPLQDHSDSQPQAHLLALFQNIYFFWVHNTTIEKNTLKQYLHE
ncbi:hypothetical protein T4A_11210 [Trichinella pseudospiralis]|uniref:Uncharacterized protein n=1 Tax=Trichinella pseudospiralis TaxID=6337 RepID=A0A0V1DTU1_TRIPS|nr:hypothetical protein T4A_11210 [Trichinella pseudospiralis]